MHARTKGAVEHPFGCIGLGQPLAVRAAQGMHLIFGHLGVHQRHFGHLMALRMGIVARQKSSTRRAGGGFERNNMIHLFDRQQRPPPPLMTGLSTRSAARASTLSSRRGRRITGRGTRRIVRGLLDLLPQRSHVRAQLLHFVPQRYDQRLGRNRRLLPIGIRKRERCWFFHLLGSMKKESPRSAGKHRSPGLG